MVDGSMTFGLISKPKKKTEYYFVGKTSMGKNIEKKVKADDVRDLRAKVVRYNGPSFTAKVYTIRKTDYGAIADKMIATVAKNSEINLCIWVPAGKNYGYRIDSYGGLFDKKSTGGRL